MTRSYTLPSVLAGIFCAFLFVSSMNVIGSFASLLIPFPMMVAGLSSAGYVGFFVSGVTATVTIAGTMGLSAAAAFLIMFLMPSVAMLVLLKHRNPNSTNNEGLGDTSGWYSASAIIVICTIAAAAFLAILFIGGMGAEGGIRSLFKESILALFGGQEGVEEMLSDSSLPYNADDFLSLVSAIAPASVTIGMFLMLIANAWLAQWLLSRLGRSVRPPLKIASVQMPEYFSIVLLLLMGASVLFGGTFALASWSLTAVFLAPYFFVGLGLVQVFSERTRYHPLFLVVFYVMMAVFPGFPLLVAIMGLADQWFGFRHRFKDNTVRPSD